MTSIEDEKKVNENYWKRIKDLQSLYKYSEEKLMNKVKKLKKEIRNVRQKLKDTENEYKSVLNDNYQLILNNEQSKNETSKTNTASGTRNKAKNNHDHEEQDPGRSTKNLTPKRKNIPEKKCWLPCKVFKESTHSVLFGCAEFKKYIPGGPNGAIRLSKDICKLCLGTVFNE